MFQSFDTVSDPSAGAARLARLRDHLRGEGLAGFLVPRADVHQGEYVAARDERLQWLTGFTGSAGFAVVLPEVAGVFIDGRYRVQVKQQVDLAVYTPVPWPEVKPGPWIVEHLEAGVVGFDPWLHTADEVARIEAALEGSGVTLRAVANAVDAIWEGQPAAPAGAAFAHPVTLAGETSEAKRAHLAEGLRKAGQDAAVITLPDSLCWLLNLRGADVPRNPILHGFAILRADATVDVFVDGAKLGAAARAALDAGVRLHPVAGFDAALRGLAGVVRVDRATAPLAVSRLVEDGGTTVAWGDDPCRLPKAAKNAAEVAGMREAHLRDGAAVVEFLCWLDQAAPKGGLTEIDVVTALEGYRRATNVLHDISFDTICGAGPNGAIMHYRVTRETNRAVGRDELLLVDSGAQYADGTTDITRTVAVGDPGAEARECYTRVLQGLIAISRVRWPRGIAGRDLDALARFHLWVAGQDFDHGTGHGVGAFLSVHEGPQRISRVSEVPLEPGMILSNEPGYYREGAFGIRLENLIVVQQAPAMGDLRDQLCFETLTFAPFDRRLIRAERLSPDERDWLDAYHAEVVAKLSPRLSDGARGWLAAACAPL
ncbi:aminopeptidase P family protein [Rhodobacteraceae bacterium HSP-20]|uniref:Aminopeptidase P family protein n=1 Tax=Paragemmobacter amnigenus TaxID=2852097 RepID=A0ABS6J869_9RHOB|nr:aminopeptidase P family protein [Rhodobacter amnigenus]MBU9699938.1 aminopeptidase P family protein [Rhodobacter amnigenus]MBV4391165.1 aminopeptidase P family protein [Rhodobacter amnigenus]